MKLYKRVDYMPWKELDKIGDGLCLDKEWTGIRCDCAMIPAPEAERAVRAWKRLEAACAPWTPERIAVWIRDIADRLSSEWISTGGLPTQLRKLADALAEAEGGGG